MKQLLLIALGPVQEFIGAARTCQDLWFGSFLLSELSRAVASSLEREGAAALIFPGSLGEEGRAGVANKILAELPDGADVRAVAGRARGALDGRLGELSEQAFARYRRPGIARHVDLERASQHVTDLMELLWVSVPLGGDYGGARRRAEELLAARKNARTWDGFLGLADVPKASIDGLRETVLEKSAASLSEDERHRLLLVKGKEQLCGVGLLKRAGQDPELEDVQRRPVFHSSSHVASHSARVAVQASPEASELFREYALSLLECGVDLRRFRVRASPEASRREALVPPSQASLGVGEGLDGVLLYPDRLADVLLERRDAAQPIDADVKTRLGRQLTHLLRCAGVPGGVASPYYAVLLADGADMGRALDLASTSSQHLAIARALDAFSRDVQGIVGAADGSLIYAGGDDVLALVPIETALRCARGLHDAFGARLQDAIPVGTPTLSVGVAVVHHLEPFGEARALAKRAEQAAKRFPGGKVRSNGPSLPAKSALAVIVSKRSGRDIELVGSFAGHDPLDRRLHGWVDAYVAERIPDKAAFALEEAIARLVPPDSTGPDSSLDAPALSLAKAALLRREIRGRDKIPEPLRDLIEASFSGTDVASSVRRLSDELQVARAFAAVQPAKASPSASTSGEVRA